MADEKYVIGLDYGTDSVRTVIFDAADGREVASDIYEYARWKKGLYCDAPANQFRQHPLDYVEGLEQTIKNALANSPAGTAEKVAGITIDTTGSTPVAVDRDGTPLSLKSGFAENPNAMFVLWKDHTAMKEADQVNELAHSGRFTDFTKYSGGIYSSEWFFAKVLHVLREDKQVREAAYSWVEHCDWMPALLTGNTDPLTLKRSRCAAGHKAMWHEDFGGLPSQDFLSALDPLLDGIRERLYKNTYTVSDAAGTLSPEWAERLGLPQSVVVGVGAFDAHLGAVGGGVEAYHLSRVMGTSTCDMLIAPMAETGDKLIAGISGQVDGSIVPGMLGMEAGQSAFGDVYAWFKKLLLWPIENLIDENSLKAKLAGQILPALTKEAEKIGPRESGVLALDWMNGRRTPDANFAVKGAITGLTLGTDAPRIYRALVEATAFGSKSIAERFRKEGVRIDGVVAQGGVARKSPFVMQTVADVLNMPIKVAATEQPGSLGSAMAAAVAAGIYPDVETAQAKMGSGYDAEYTPNPEMAKVYEELYQQYEKLGRFVEEQLS
jgi:L-ribulokinase